MPRRRSLRSWRRSMEVGSCLRTAAATPPPPPTARCLPPPESSGRSTWRAVLGSTARPGQLPHVTAHQLTRGTGSPSAGNRCRCWPALPRQRRFRYAPGRLTRWPHPSLPTAVRMTWNVWPHSRLEAAKCVIPFCTLYTPARQTSQLQVGGAVGGAVGGWVRVRAGVWFCSGTGSCCCRPLRSMQQGAASCRSSSMPGHAQL